MFLLPGAGVHAVVMVCGDGGPARRPGAGLAWLWIVMVWRWVEWVVGFGDGGWVGVLGGGSWRRGGCVL